MPPLLLTRSSPNSLDAPSQTELLLRFDCSVQAEYIAVSYSMLSAAMRIPIFFEASVN